MTPREKTSVRRHRSGQPSPHNGSTRFFIQHASMDERTSYGPKATGKPAGSHEELSALLGGRIYRAIRLLFVLALFFRYFDTLSRVVLLAFTGIIIGIVFNRSEERR